MHLLAQFATLFGLEAEALVDRAKGQATVAAALGFFGVIAVAFLLIAAYLALSTLIGLIWAALAIAGVALVITLGIYVWARAADARRKREEAERRRSAEASNLITTAAFTALPMALSSPTIRKIALPLATLATIVFFVGREGQSGKEKN